MSNNTNTFAQIDRSLESILKGDKPVPMSAVTRLVETTGAARVTVARFALAVRERGIVGIPGDPAASLTELAKRLADDPANDKRVQVKRSQLSKMASALAWLEKSGTAVTAVTFAAAHTIYGRSKEARDGIGDFLKATAALPESERAAAWQDALATRVDKPKDPKAPKAPKVKATAEETREAWLKSLDTLAATAEAILPNMSDAQNAHARDALARIVAVASATRTANTGSGRA